MSRYDDEFIMLPIGWMLEQCSNWDELCNEVGLNPWVLSEGLAEGIDLYPITIKQAVKHGLLRG